MNIRYEVRDGANTILEWPATGYHDATPEQVQQTETEIALAVNPFASEDLAGETHGLLTVVSIVEGQTPGVLHQVAVRDADRGSFLSAIQTALKPLADGCIASGSGDADLDVQPE